MTRAAWAVVAAFLTFILLTPHSCVEWSHGPPPTIRCDNQIGLTFHPESLDAPWFVLYSWGLPVLVGAPVFIGLTVLGARRTARSDRPAGSAR